MSDDKLEIVRGSDNPFRDAGLPDPDTRLMKADLAAEIVRVLRERDLAGAKAADLAGVPEADISRIRHADLGRFTVDRLVKILNRLDGGIEVGVTLRPRDEEDRRRAQRPLRDEPTFKAGASLWRKGSCNLSLTPFAEERASSGWPRTGGRAVAGYRPLSGTNYVDSILF